LVDESRGGPEDLVGEYLATLGDRSVATVEAYERILRSLAGRVSERPGGSAVFRPELLTRTAVEGYPKELEGREMELAVTASTANTIPGSRVEAIDAARVEVRAGASPESRAWPRRERRPDRGSLK
jgi:hypothetical protein